jgi:hypothetical protein
MWYIDSTASFGFPSSLDLARGPGYRLEGGLAPFVGFSLASKLCRLIFSFASGGGIYCESLLMHM